MKPTIFQLRRFDWPLLICTVLLIGIGLLSLYSSSIGGADYLNFKKQLIFACIALFFMFFVSFMDWRILRNEPRLILSLYILGCLALAGLFFFAPEIRATKGWYRVGPVSIDPIEFMKIILIILTLSIWGWQAYEALYQHRDRYFRAVETFANIEHDQ